MEDIGLADRQEIERRLRSGEKATHIALGKGLLLPQVVSIAKIAGIKLKSGRRRIVDDPELYRKHIDEKFGPGAADNFKLWPGRLTYVDIGQALGGMSRGSAHYYCKIFAGGAPKPVVPHRPVELQRADITKEKVRRSARRCLSVAAMERDLHANGSVIYDRARIGNIALPDGHQNLTVIMPDRRPDITRKRMRRLAKKLPTLTAMALAFNTNIATIKRRAGVNSLSKCNRLC